MKPSHWIFIFAGLLITAIIIGVIVYFQDDNNNNNDGKDTLDIDESDVPIPPSSLEYNKTYAAPKRTSIITGGSSSGKPTVHFDERNRSYTYIPEDSGYSL